MLCVTFPKNGFKKHILKCHFETCRTFAFGLKVVPKPIPKMISIADFKFKSL